MIKKVLFVVLITVLSFCSLQGQNTVLSEATESTSGASLTSTNYSLDYTIGQPIAGNGIGATWTISSGYIQKTFDKVDADFQVINQSCPRQLNGQFIFNSAVGCPGPYTVEVFDTFLVKLFNPRKLPKGHYTAVVRGLANACKGEFRFKVLLSKEECDINFFSAISPNDDGLNDVWEIDNITAYPQNEIVILNRFGQKVWEGKNYDNGNVVFKGYDLNGRKLVQGTYFYLAEIADESYNGWVEIVY